MYFFYNTVLCTSSGKMYWAHMPVWGASPTLACGTIVIAHVKVHTVCLTNANDTSSKKHNINILLDSMMIKELLGDPSAVDHEKYAPNMPLGFVTCNEVILFPTETAKCDGHSHTFTLKVSDYVRDSAKTSTVRYAATIVLLSSRSLMGV